MDKRKSSPEETYEDIIWDLIEDTLELNPETKKELEDARAEIKAGNSHTLTDIKKNITRVN